MRSAAGPAPELQLSAPRRCRAAAVDVAAAARVLGRLPKPLDDRRRTGTDQREAALRTDRRSGIAPTSDSSVAPTSGSGIAPTSKPLMPLGQFRDTFIIAVDEDGIAIIDQHVAHERVLFERITERLTSGRLESQRLLEPMLVEHVGRGTSGAGRACRRARTSRFRGRGVRRRLAARLGVSGVADPRALRGRAARAGRGSRGARSRIARSRTR